MKRLPRLTKPVAKDGVEVPPLDYKAIGRELNQVRNELKHNDRGKNSPVFADIWNEAVDMALRAIENYEKLYGKLPPQKETRVWYEWMTQ